MHEPTSSETHQHQNANTTENIEFSEFDVSLYTARALRAISLMAIGLAILCATGLLTEKTFLAHRALKCITLPIILFLYLNRPEPSLQKIYGSLSPIASGWALAGFFFTLIASFKYGGYGLFVALLCSTFIYVRPVPLFRQIFSQKLAGMVMLLGAISGPVLVVIHRMIWEPIAMFHLYIMELWMTLFYSRIHIVGKADVTGSGNFRKIAREVGAISGNYNRSSNDFAAIIADGHHLHFTPGNNMMNAYFLFIFLLAALLLRKKHIFQLISLKKTIVLMLLAIMLFTPLGMTILFMITQAGEAKNADPLTSWIASVSDKKSAAGWGWAGYFLIETLLFYGVIMLFGRKTAAVRASRDPYA